jgi:hypothetical protein
LVRSLQAANALTTLARDQILQGQLDPPQTVLRKLFEKLGATYVKLGQFVASSPSLFPEGERQRCCDTLGCQLHQPPGSCCCRPDATRAHTCTHKHHACTQPM